VSPSKRVNLSNQDLNAVVGFERRERDWHFVVRPELKQSHALRSLFLMVERFDGEGI
jgi:hypothetical protein